MRFGTERGSTLLANSSFIRLFFAYTRGVASQICTVSFTDSSGVRHSVEVAAGSLYEAAALALAEFRSSPMLQDNGPGAATVFSVSVRGPSTEHAVPVKRLLSWLRSSGKTPKEEATKAAFRTLTG